MRQCRSHIIGSRNSDRRRFFMSEAKFILKNNAQAAAHPSNIHSTFFCTLLLWHIFDNFCIFSLLIRLYKRRRTPKKKWFTDFLSSAFPPALSPSFLSPSPLPAFPFYSEYHWQEKSVRRAYFDSFSHVRGFDPLEAKNWKSITLETLQSEKVNGS